MIYYIIPYIFAVLSSIFFYFSNKKNSIFIPFICLIPAIFIVLFRGNTGIDTYTYLDYFRDLINSIESQSNFEIGFTFLSKLLIVFRLNERQAVAVIGFLIILCICLSLKDSKKKNLFFSLLIFPIFFYDMTMNGLRYGIAFAISRLAVESLLKEKYIKFSLISFCAISMQISALIIIILFFIQEISKKYVFLLLFLFFSIITLIINFVELDLSYFYSKQDLYKELYSPDITSGLSTVFLYLVVYIVFLIHSYKNTEKNITIIHITLILEVLSFGLSKISYSGLRFQMLFLFVLLIYIENNLQLISNFKRFIILIAVVGVIGFFITARHFQDKNDDDVLSPFLPYKFYWNELN